MLILRILLISSILTGCGIDRVKREPPPQIITKWQTYNCGVAPYFDKLDFLPVIWVIIEGKYTLSTDMYANLADNMSGIKQGVGQLQEIIRFYINCIDAAQKTAKEKPK